MSGRGIINTTKRFREDNELEKLDEENRLKKFKEDNEDIKNFNKEELCNKHNRKLIKFCFKCKTEICIECLETNKHIGHKLKYPMNSIYGEPNNLSKELRESEEKFYIHCIENCKVDFPNSYINLSQLLLHPTKHEIKVNNQVFNKKTLIEKAIELNPNESDYQVEFGKIFSPIYPKENIPMLKNRYLKALELKKDNSMAMCYLAHLIHPGDIELPDKSIISSVKLYFNAAQLDPFNPNVYHEISKSLLGNEKINLHNGTFNKKELIEKAAKLNTTLPEIYISLFDLMENNDKPVIGLSRINSALEAIKQDPFNSIGYYSLGLAFIQAEEENGVEPDHLIEYEDLRYKLPNDVYYNGVSLIKKAIQLNPYESKYYATLATQLLFEDDEESDDEDDNSDDEESNEIGKQIKLLDGTIMNKVDLFEKAFSLDIENSTYSILLHHLESKDKDELCFTSTGTVYTVEMLRKTLAKNNITDEN